MAAPRTARTSVPRRSRTPAATSHPWLDPGHAGENLEIEDFPSFLILRLSTLIKNNLTRRYLDPFGLSMPEWRLLGLVTRTSPMPFSELTAGSGMDKGQVSRTLHAIQSKGLVRVNAVTAAGRGGVRRGMRTLVAPRIEVGVTPKGRALYQRVIPAARETQLRILDMMSADERDVFYTVTRRLHEQLALIDREGA